MGFIKNKPIPVALINKANKSICQIRTKDNYGCKGTGFFMRIFSRKYLITCSFVVNYGNKKENTEIEIEIYNKEVITIKLHDRFIKCLEMSKYILAIELKDSDFMDKDIEFLDYDQDYLNKGYSIYNDFDIFSLSYIYDLIGNGVVCSSGKIEGIYKGNDYEFYHSISTGDGSSGSPIILLSNSKILKVIGIHTSYQSRIRMNKGIFIGELIKELPKNMNFIQDSNKNKIFVKNNINNIKKKIDNVDDNLDINKLTIGVNNLNINKNIKSNDLYKNKLINLNIDLTKNAKKDIINFSIKSTDQFFNCNILCRINDIFNTIMNIIVEKEPSLTEKIGFFLCKGYKINEYKNIKDNEINNNDIILMTVPD